MKKRMKHGNRKFSKSSFSRACLFLLPSLISVLVLFVMPYLDVIRRSFLDGTEQRFVGMENYKTVVENTSFRLAAGVVSLKRLLNQSNLKSWSSKMIKKSLEAYFFTLKNKIVFCKKQFQNMSVFCFVSTEIV